MWMGKLQQIIHSGVKGKSFEILQIYFLLREKIFCTKNPYLVI